MLRPATPLAIIFFVAFVLLLLPTLSVPIIRGIPIGSYKGSDYGVFGYCDNESCHGPTLPYESNPQDNNFSLDNTSTRKSLSYILVVHPIAAFLTLICFGLAVAAHFHAPSHSPRYLLALLIFTIPTLLVSLLAFLVDILLFVPHMTWGGWIVLGATILIVASSVLTCAMRRTLVSRKARKKRIAENVEMNGQAYHENLSQNRMMVDTTLPRAESPPPLHATTSAEKEAGFVSFEMKRQHTDGGYQVHPTPSIHSARSVSRSRHAYGDIPPPVPVNGPSHMNANGRPGPSRDQYGNPIPPDMAHDPAALRHHGSEHSLRSHGSNGSRGSRARGRPYGPPPRGYMGPGGVYGLRGGYGPRRGGPPPPWNGRGRGYGPPPMGTRSSPPPRSGPPPGYANDSYPGGQPPMPIWDSSSSTGPPPDPYMSDSPMPIGTAVEMDERTGSQPAVAWPNGSHMSPHYGHRDNNGDNRGMTASPYDAHGGVDGYDTQTGGGARDAQSDYLEQAYMPPRRQWTNPISARGLTASPLAVQHDVDTHAPPPVSSAHSAVLHNTSPHSAPSDGPYLAHSRSEDYYEDVDPRFVVDERPAAPPKDDYPLQQDPSIPPALTPGGAVTPGALAQTIPGNFPETPGAGAAPPRTYQAMHRMPYPLPPRPGSPHPSHAGGSSLAANTSSGNSDAPLVAAATTTTSSSPVASDHVDAHAGDGAHSPIAGSERASETSHFTSISERPVNPHWRAPPPPVVPYPRRKDDVLLTGNPEFALPSTTGRRARQSSRAAASAGLTPVDRYPTDV